MIAIDRLGNFGLLLVVVGTYLAYDTLIFDEVFYVISVAQNVKLEPLGYSLDALMVLNALLILAAITKCAQLGFQRETSVEKWSEAPTNRAHAQPCT